MIPEQYLQILARILHAPNRGIGSERYANAIAFARQNHSRLTMPFTVAQEAVRHSLMTEIAQAPHAAIWLNYDFLRVEQAPDAFVPGEAVSMTEKLHGSCCIVGLVNGVRVVSTKRFAKDGVALPEDDGRFWQAARRESLHEKLIAYATDTGTTDLLLIGEVYGPTVQDLTYGVDTGEIGYRAFDLYIRQRWNASDPLGNLFAFLPVDTFFATTSQLGIPRVPEVWRGPYSHAAVTAHTRGQSTLAAHVREGVVIKPLEERTIPKLGRLILKSISPEYLARSGATDNE